MGLLTVVVNGSCPGACQDVRDDEHVHEELDGVNEARVNCPARPGSRDDDVLFPAPGTRHHTQTMTGIPGWLRGHANA